MMPQPPIAGRRVCLRDMTLDDLPAWERWMLPGNAWQRLDGPYYPKPSVEDVTRLAAAARERIAASTLPDPRTRLVVAEIDTDRLLGMVTRYWESEETNWLSLGIVLYDPETWGRGYGYEALGLWCDYLLVAMPELARLDLRTWSGNLGMMALAGKLGFVEEARFRRARIVDGSHYDGMGYGILREEWLARYPAGFAASLT